jgi:hypothetical protein
MGGSERIIHLRNLTPPARHGASDEMARGVVASMELDGRVVLRAGAAREGGNGRALPSRDGTGVGLSIRCRDTRSARSRVAGLVRSSPGLSGIADLGGPRLEGLGPDGETQVSGESPLAVTSVPPLPCPVACPPGPGCVHRRLLSMEYTTGWRVSFARPGISRFFCPGSSQQSGSGLVRPGPCGAPPGRQGHCSTGYIVLSR